MKNRQKNSKSGYRRNGFTLIEMMVAIAIIAIMAAIATPTIIQWRQNLVFRQVSRDVASMLRDARNRAIATNLQHQVQFAGNTYTMIRGNLSAGSNFLVPPSVIAKSTAPLPTGVNLGIGVGCAAGALAITFNPNGTSTAGGPVCILDPLRGAGFPIYQVTINAITGGVTMSQKLN